MLERFVQAQGGNYDRALEEVKSGRKRTHWMWFIFPQIAGLGHSYMSKLYAIKDIDEAREYLAHPILGKRLREISHALLSLDTCDPHSIVGSPDDFKLRSCMTLFNVVEPDSVFAEVLKKFYCGMSDRRTLSILSGAKDVSYQQVENVNPADDIANSPALPLIGSICGDVIGSSYEWHPVKCTDFSLFTPRSKFTDDTVCSVAVADALINGNNFVETLQHWCRKYPKSGYGGAFRLWIKRDDPHPYNSWGNGSAMRVSAVGAYANSVSETLQLAQQSAEVTHNHPEGIKGAQATALAIYLAKTGKSKDEIKQELESCFGYDLHRKYSDIQPSYHFDVSCQGSVSEAIIAFLESHDYESAIRLSVALGGDADTQAAIAGGIAAAFYGEISENILSECYRRLPGDMKNMISKFNSALSSRQRQ